MICARFKENRNFISTPYWQLHVTLKQGEAHRQFVHPEEFKDKETAGTAYRKITSGSVATVTKVERKRTFQQSPLLYDLTTLQKDCNVYYDLTADKTLSIAQALYEKKLISYPRTGSRYIPEDVMAHIPSLLEKVVAMPDFKEYGNTLDFSGLNTRSVDNAKVTDHHALIITGIAPHELSEAESAVYTLIAGRMLESFSPLRVKRLGHGLLLRQPVSGNRNGFVFIKLCRPFIPFRLVLVPTEKGLCLYESVKDMMVADAELTGTWGKALSQIEGHTLDTGSFLLSIKGYAKKVTEEILRLKFPEPSSCALACPKSRPVVW